MSFIVELERKRKIDDDVKVNKKAERQFLGRRATYYKSHTDKKSISSLYSSCLNRKESIAKTIDNLRINDNINEIDTELFNLSKDKKIVSVTPTSLDTYILKGVSIPAKQAVTTIFSQTASIVATMSSFVTSSLSSLLGFSINVILALKDLKKNGGSPSYASYIYSFYTLQFFALIFGAFITFITIGAKYITPIALIIVAIFFLINLIFGFIFKLYDHHIAYKIDEKVEDNLYLNTRLKIMEK